MRSVTSDGGGGELAEAAARPFGVGDAAAGDGGGIAEVGGDLEGDEEGEERGDGGEDDGALGGGEADAGTARDAGSANCSAGRDARV